MSEPVGVGTWTCRTCGYQGAVLTEEDGDRYVMRVQGGISHDCQARDDA